MIKFENTEIVGWEAAIRGMRNPMNSWNKSDSCFIGYGDAFDINGNVAPYNGVLCDGDVEVGLNDLSLMTRLRNAGTDHRKFMRMIVVYVDITAPLYWWKEFDTYKVGTVANSCSTMHKIAEKEFTIDDFSYEHLNCSNRKILLGIIDALNEARNSFNHDGGKTDSDWWQMIQLLPSSYNQRRTVMMSYEVLANIYKSRKDHKLDEWCEHAKLNKYCSFGFCDWINDLAYSELITGKFSE